MTNVQTARPRQDSSAAPRGETTSTHDRHATSSVERDGGGMGATQPDPQLPHEHDESSHSQASAAVSHGEVGKQALSDLQDGKQDTDKGPEMDRVYNEKVAPHRGPARPRE